MYNELVDAVGTGCCSLARYVLLFGILVNVMRSYLFLSVIFNI